MKSEQRIEHRAACAALLGTSASAILAGQSQAKPKTAAQGPEILEYQNNDFYSSDGRFDEAAAKSAYLKLMEIVGISVSDYVRTNLWVAEFRLGRFSEVGLGGVFWVNDKKWNYASVDIFLLPNQMIPEHWQQAGPKGAMVTEVFTYHTGDAVRFTNPNIRF